MHNMLIRIVEAGSVFDEDVNDVIMELFNLKKDVVRDVSDERQESEEISDLDLGFEAF